MSKKQHGRRALPWGGHERGPWHDTPRAVLDLLRPNRRRERRARMVELAETWASRQAEWAEWSQILLGVLAPVPPSRDGEEPQYGPYRVVPARMTACGKSGYWIFSRTEGDAQTTDGKEEVWVRPTSDGRTSAELRELHVVTRSAVGVDGKTDGLALLDSRIVRLCSEADSVISPGAMMAGPTSQHLASRYPVLDMMAGRQMNVGISRAKQGAELIGGVLADLVAVGYLVRVASDASPGKSPTA